MTFQVPGKTYLVGEYAVLVEGPALGLATEPCFELDFTEKQSQQKSLSEQVHPQSPAGLYLNRYQKDVQVELSNPYQGGFGKSTAEYWAAVIPDLLTGSKKFDDILSEYRELHSGSGIDLAIQYYGAVTEVQNAKSFQNHTWPFSELDFFILSTGIKVATHEHLQSLKTQDLAVLPAISQTVIDSFKVSQVESFIENMQKWVQALRALQLTCVSSVQMCEHLMDCPQIQLAKPCGALGADVLLVFYFNEDKSSVRQYLTESHYHIVADRTSLHPGMRYQLTSEAHNRKVSHVD